MKRTHTIAIGVGAGLVLLFGVAQLRSTSKCRARLAAIRKAYPGKTDAERKASVKAMGGDWPDCSGVTLFREGI